MKIDVPLVKQKDKNGCGAAGMSMIYKFFGVNLSQEEIIKKIGGLTRWGSFTVDHALMANELGFSTTVYSYNLEYYDPSDSKLSRKELIKKTGELIKKENRQYNIRELKSILKVLRSDVSYEMRIPTLNSIKKFLDKRIPVVVAVNSAVLFEKKKDLRWGHFLALTGYEKNRFYYNDPHGIKGTISDEKLIFALSNNVFDSSAYLLVIKPKN
jgi:hypothetical protein